MKTILRIAALLLCLALAFPAMAEQQMMVLPELLITEALPEETPGPVPAETNPPSPDYTTEPAKPAPEMLLPDKLALAPKEKVQLDVRFSDGGNYPLSFASRNEDVAAIDESGMITALRKGSTVIRVWGPFGDASIDVQVKKAPESVKITAPKKTLGVGEEMQLAAKLNSGSASQIRYTSSDESVLCVNERGVAVALAPGKATITGKTCNNKKHSIKITVVPAPESLSVPDDIPVLGVGEEYALAPAIDSGCAAAFFYESGDAAIASVDASGCITGQGPGEASIRISTHNGLAAEISVTVKAAPTKISLEKSSITIGKGEKVDMPDIQLGEPGDDCGGSYTIKRSGEHAVINQDGRIHGKSTGTSTFTIKTYNGKKATLKVKVVSAPNKISFSTKELALGLGETRKLQASLPKKSASAIAYSSDNEAVAIVAADGSVTALAPGSAAITAATFNGKKAKCIVTVYPAPESIALNINSLTLGDGESAQLDAQLNEGCAGAFRYESSDADVATVNEKGKVKAVGPGEAEIRAVAYNGVSDACSVTVLPAPKKISLQQGSLVITKGDSYQLPLPVLSPEDAYSSTLKYKSSNSSVAAVSAGGVITGKRTGSATITVSTFNGKKSTLKVKVVKSAKAIAFAAVPDPMTAEDIYTPTVRFSNKAAGSFSYTSSDEGVVSISRDGRSIIAVSPGSAEITATAFNGLQTSMTVQVKPLPEQISVHPAGTDMGLGDSIRLSVSIPEGQGSPIAYTSSNGDIASVDAGGLITAHAFGTAEITAHTRNGKTAACIVTVKNPPTHLALSPRSARRSIDEGGLQLSCSYGSESEAGSVAFTSSNEAVATVDTSGYVRFIAPGKVRITGRTYNGRIGHCDLEIGSLPGSMAFPAGEMFIALGDIAEIPVQFEAGCESYTLTAEDSGIALCSGDTVLGLSVGSTTLTAVSRSGLSATCTLTVAEAPTGIQLQDEQIELILHISDPYPLAASALPGGVGSVYFSSSDPHIASVDRITGEISAIGIGSCDIIAESYDGLRSARCRVTVRHLLEGVKVGVDPGHQKHANYDKEAISPDFKGSKIKVAAGATGVSSHRTEHSINLEVGLKLRDALEYFGAEVYMTRETADVDISNKQRALMMNELGVDVVLHLHCDSSDSGGKGMTIFTRKTGTGKTESYNAARQVNKYMVRATGAYNRGVKKTNEFTGLNWSTVPSMLIEMGFLSNSKEDKLLVSDAYQQKLVQGMVNGICAYMDRELPYD